MTIYLLDQAGSAMNESNGCRVSVELSDRTADAGTVTFMHADHLLGSVQRIAASRDDTRIVLPGKGEVCALHVYSCTPHPA